VRNHHFIRTETPMGYNRGANVMAKKIDTTKVETRKSMSFKHSYYTTTFYDFIYNGMRVMGNLVLEVITEKPHNKKRMILKWDCSWDRTTKVILNSDSLCLCCNTLKDAKIMVQKMCESGEVAHNCVWAKNL